MSRYLHSLLYNWVTLFFCAMSCFVGTSVVAQMVKNLPAMQETHVQSLGWEDPLEKGMTPHSGTLAWRIPRTEEPGGLQSMGSQRVRHDWVTKHCTCFLVFTFSFLLPKNKQTNKQTKGLASLCGPTEKGAGRRFRRTDQTRPLPSGKCNLSCLGRAKNITAQVT